MKKLRFNRQWLRPLLWLTTPLIALSGLLFWRLGTSPAAGSALELTQCTSGLQLDNSFLNAPYQLLQHALPFSCSPEHLAWVRLPSVLVAIAAGLLFIAAVRSWFGRRAAIYGGILFIGSSWFLHAGRIGSADSLWLLVAPALILLYQRLQLPEVNRRTVILLIFTVSLLLYIPGGIWFVLILLSFFSNTIAKLVRSAQPAGLVVSGVYLLAALAPVMYSFVQEPSQWMRWLGLPSILDTMQLLRQLAAVPLHLVARGPEAPAIWLGHRPILDVFTVACLIIGFVWLARRSKPRRLVFLIVLGTFCWLLAAARPTGIASLNAVVPLAFFIAAAGIQALLRRWFGVFPRNPFAKWLAYGLLALVVASSVALSTREYFVAWPNAPATRQTFTITD